MTEPRVIVALDVADPDEAWDLARRLDPALCRLKVGKELFTRAGPTLVEALQGQGFAVFLDLKFHDIPHTVGRACRAAADLGVWMVNVHALGGRQMLTAAREALAGPQSPLLIGVTVLTSLDDAGLHEVGLGGSVADNVQRLAQLTFDCALDGVVCSPQEARRLRARYGPRFTLVAPGIRPGNAEADDQSRVTTPQQAHHNGVDYLVVGRPITQASDPYQALLRINDEIS